MASHYRVPFMRRSIAKRPVRAVSVGGAIVLATLVAAGTAFADPAAATPDQAEANRLMNLSAAEFNAAPHNPPFDWSTDGCSGPVRPDFTPACVQHDFGYRNYGATGKLGFAVNRDTKNWIDMRFREEMYRICQDGATPTDVDTQCIPDADNTFAAVNLFGDSHFFGNGLVTVRASGALLSPTR